MKQGITEINFPGLRTRTTDNMTDSKTYCSIMCSNTHNDTGQHSVHVYSKMPFVIIAEQL